jgi:hypothetical protein
LSCSKSAIATLENYRCNMEKPQIKEKEKIIEKKIYV